MSVRRSRTPKGLAGAAGIDGASGAAPYLCYRAQAATGTDAGTATADGTFKTVPITDEVSDVGGFGALSANQITLAAGTYTVHASVLSYGALSRLQGRLRNVTAGTTLVAGTSRFQNQNPVTGPSAVIGQFTVAASQALELQGRVENTGTGNGWGDAVNFDEVEVYSLIEFWKTA